MSKHVSLDHHEILIRRLIERVEKLELAIKHLARHHDKNCVVCVSWLKILDSK